MLWSTTKRPRLKTCDVGLRTYSGEFLKVLGCIDVTVCYDQQCHPLQLVVVPTDGPPLFGLNWLQAIKQNWKEVHFMHHKEQHQSLQDMCTKYIRLFENGMETLQGLGVKVKIHIRPDACSSFFVQGQYLAP